VPGWILDRAEEKEMRPGAWIASLMFAGIVAGCSLPTQEAAVAPTAPLTITPNVPMVVAPILHEPTNTPVPRPVYATGRSLPVNCRFGPGTIYAVVSRLDAGQSTRIRGKDYTGSWMYISDPLNPGGYCWVSTAPVDIEGDALALPQVDPPYVTVNKLDVWVESQRITVACDNFPQYALFIAEVTVNGPTLVQWRWEYSTGEATEPQVMLFEQAETRTLQGSFVVNSPNDYWARMHINAPNEIVEQTNLVANCTQ
jgi:SH3-like domain-containing protein